MNCKYTGRKIVSPLDMKEYRVICCACGQWFDELKERPPLPTELHVCSGCADTMKPCDGE